MNSRELDIADINRTISTSEALTDLLFVEEIERYRPFDPTEVSITPLPLDEFLDIGIATELGSNLSGVINDDTLGKIIVNAALNDLLELKRHGATEAFLLYWHGSCRVPAGVAVGGKIICHTQWGLVKDEQGSFIGTYQRLLDQDNVGDARDDPANAMLVFI